MQHAIVDQLQNLAFTPKGITEDAAELCQNDPKDMNLPDQTYSRDDLTAGDANNAIPFLLGCTHVIHTS